MCYTVCVISNCVSDRLCSCFYLSSLPESLIISASSVFCHPTSHIPHLLSRCCPKISNWFPPTGCQPKTHKGLMKSPKTREGPGGCFYKYKEKAYMFDILILRRHIQDWLESLKKKKKQVSGGEEVEVFTFMTLYQYHVFQC